MTSMSQTKNAIEIPIRILDGVPFIHTWNEFTRNTGGPAIAIYRLVGEIK
jgi:hypothetical protein